MSPITKKDLQRVYLAIMVVFLVGTAPHWLSPANQHASSYDAPWVYPGLEPQQH